MSWLGALYFPLRTSIAQHHRVSNELPSSHLSRFVQIAHLSRKTLFASLSRCGCGRNANFTQHVSLFEQVKLLKPDRETTGPIEALSRGMFVRNSIQTHACSLRFPVIILSPLGSATDGGSNN